MEKLLALSGAFDSVLPAHGPLEIGPDVLPDLIAMSQALLKGELAGEKDRAHRALPAL
jgi:hypothetical protein